MVPCGCHQGLLLRVQSCNPSVADRHQLLQVGMPFWPMPQRQSPASRKRQRSSCCVRKGAETMAERFADVSSVPFGRVMSQTCRRLHLSASAQVFSTTCLDLHLQGRSSSTVPQHDGPPGDGRPSSKPSHIGDVSCWAGPGSAYFSSLP